MRVIVLGGTRFIGAATVDELVGHGHEVTLVHRGETERDDLPEVPHAHLHRHDVEAMHRVLRDTGAQAVIDTCAYTRRDAETIAEALPSGVRHVAISSVDTYRQFHRLREGLRPLDPLPLDEDSPTRTGSELYLFRGEPATQAAGVADMDSYENLDVEEVVLRRGGCVLRLPIVYGERDPIRREEFILRHVRSGASRIEIGAGTWLCSRAWVRDVASAIRLAAETGAGDGRVLNLAERQTLPVAAWAQAILDAAGSGAELVTVADDELEGPSRLTRTLSQHVLVDSSRARRLLGWEDTEPAHALAASVRWHLAHPPPG